MKPEKRGNSRGESGRVGFPCPGPDAGDPCAADDLDFAPVGQAVAFVEDAAAVVVEQVEGFTVDAAHGLGGGEVQGRG